MPLRSANKTAGRGVCCWRFVRLETGTGAAGTRSRSRRPHAVRRAYIYIYMHAVPLRLPRTFRGTTGFLLVVVSVPSSSNSTARLYLAVPPDFFFHVRPTLRVLSDFFPLQQPRYARISLSLSLASRSLLSDFFYGETDRGVIYRACSQLLEPLDDVAF